MPRKSKNPRKLKRKANENTNQNGRIVTAIDNYHADILIEDGQISTIIILDNGQKI